MDAFLGQTRLALEDRDLLGVGGEGRVYRWRDRAVKILHAMSSGPAPADEARARRALVIEKVRRFPRGLAREVIGPTDVVTDARGDVVGFTMPLVSSATEVTRLGQRKWREGALSNGEVVAFFRRLRSVVLALHARDVCIGDFNDANVLFSTDAQGALTPALIDADSMQFDGLPCVVAHERFLDPRLYGVDLAKSPAFDESTDWYAFGVMLFASLLYAHPYGGMHPRYPTLLRRAEARHSILRHDVSYPRAASHFAILPDELLHWAESTFDRGARGAVPESMLEMRWTRCSCGVEHARRSCPDCAAPRAVAATSVHGGCRATLVRRARGRILGAAAQGTLAYLYEEDGIVRREDGSEVVSGLAAGTRFAFAGPSTWVARGDKLARVAHGRVLETATTTTFAGEPSFDANAAGCFVVGNDFIADVSRGTRVGQVVDGQTWLRVGDALGFGFYQCGAVREHFLFHLGRGGLTRVALPNVRGRLVDAAAWFDRDRILFATASDVGGARRHELHFIAQDGSVIASACGSPDDQPLLASMGGKCLAHGAILCATDEGLLLARPDAKTREIVTQKIFTDTRPFVSTGVDLVPAPGGAVHVIAPREIMHLSLG